MGAAGEALAGLAVAVADSLYGLGREALLTLFLLHHIFAGVTRSRSFRAHATSLVAINCSEDDYCR